MRRASGDTAITSGNATSHADSHEATQRPTKPGSHPVARNVDSPDTRKDISPDRMSANSAGAKLFGIMRSPRPSTLYGRTVSAGEAPWQHSAQRGAPISRRQAQRNLPAQRAPPAPSARTTTRVDWPP